MSLNEVCLERLTHECRQKWEEDGMAYFKVLSQRLSRDTEETHDEQVTCVTVCHCATSLCSKDTALC